jgi:hypothetical protein
MPLAATNYRYERKEVSDLPYRVILGGPHKICLLSPNTSLIKRATNLWFG